MITQAQLAAKNSKTPVADRLIARHIGKIGQDAVSARQLLKNCLTRGTGTKRDYVPGHQVADELRGLFFSPANACLADAVALMQEAGIPAKYWGKAAMELAAQKKSKARLLNPFTPQQKRPLPLAA